MDAQRCGSFLSVIFRISFAIVKFFLTPVKKLELKMKLRKYIIGFVKIPLNKLTPQ